MTPEEVSDTSGTWLNVTSLRRAIGAGTQHSPRRSCPKFVCSYILLLSKEKTVIIQIYLSNRLLKYFGLSV